MTHYIHVDVTKVAQREYMGYVRDYDYHVVASTRSGVEYEVYRTLEQREGLHSFAIIFGDA